MGARDAGVVSTTRWPGRLGFHWSLAAPFALEAAPVREAAAVDDAVTTPEDAACSGGFLRTVEVALSLA
jgi:hypothetical protein